MRVNEIFYSIQGEGDFAGSPMVFVRLSGCTRKCSWCDTKYHKNGNEISIKDVIGVVLRFRENKKDELTICFTGGEPLLQITEIIEFMHEISKKGSFDFHLETNGDLIGKLGADANALAYFSHISCSPKDVETAKKVVKYKKTSGLRGINIKVVSDLKKIGVDMLEYANSVMPFTDYKNEKRTKKIMENVWRYCSLNNKKFSPRLHYTVFGNLKGI